MNTILQFMFETGDASCKYYEVYVIVQSEDYIDYATIEDSIVSYFDSVDTDDTEYEDNVEDIMRESGLSWSFMGSVIPESKAIHTFWI